MEQNWISCNTCGADDYQVMTYASDWPIGRCAQCGQVYVNPIPATGGAAGNCQRHRSATTGREKLGEITVDRLRYDEIQLKRHLVEIRRLTDQGWSVVKFLDIGCGSGASVKAAALLGWEATGLDIDADQIAVGRRQFGLDLCCSTLPEARLPADRFHFVRLREVIEHLPNPYESLLEIRRVLVRGGVLLLTTPNEDGLSSQLRTWLHGRPTTVASVPPPHHLHGFSPDTLARILARTGFNIMEIRTTSPVNPAYVAIDKLRNRRNFAFELAWKSASMLGRGSTLVAWSRK